MEIENKHDDSERLRKQLRSLANGYQTTALLTAAVKLGLADLLSHRPRSIEDLSEELGAHTESLRRVLRGLIAIGICSETSIGVISLTSLGKLLRKDIPGSLANVAIQCGNERSIAWSGLDQCVMTGEAGIKAVTGYNIWEWRLRHSDQNTAFNAAQRQTTTRFSNVLFEAIDFSSHQYILDIGGGLGGLLVSILQAYPHLKGALLDQHHVIVEAQDYIMANGVQDRCSCISGSFFDALPTGADLHMLKNVLHDWNDVQARLILERSYEALEPNGKVLIVEHVLTDSPNADPDMILADLQMLALTGGLERSERMFGKLLQDAGFVHLQAQQTSTGHWVFLGQRKT